MPGGRVQPVIIRAPVLTGTQKSESARLSQLEEVRKQTIIAQQTLAANIQMNNDRMLRQQHESKLNETAGDELGRQRDADEELRQYQAAGLLAEQKREQDAMIERARQALEEKIPEPVLLTPVSVTPVSVVPVVTEPRVDVPMDAEAELLQIRARINSVLNDDVLLA